MQTPDMGVFSEICILKAEVAHFKWKRPEPLQLSQILRMQQDAWKQKELEHCKHCKLLITDLPVERAKRQPGWLKTLGKVI